MRILYVTCNYLPEKIGGTEVYLHELIRELIRGGHEIFINFIGGFFQAKGSKIRRREYVFEGIPVTVIEKNTFGLKTAQLYFVAQQEVYWEFRKYLGQISPDIVHFHHFSPTDVILQMEAVKALDLPVIFTYHTPMVACSRSDMLFKGGKPCGGEIIYKRCLACSQTRFGIPYPLAYLWANLPQQPAKLLGKTICYLNLKSPLATYLQLPWLTRQRIERWKSGLNLVDHFVAVCQWAYELLLKNGLPPQKISLSRQGIGRLQVPASIKKQNNGVLRLGYLGRIHPVKGIDLLLEAFKKLFSYYRINLDIYGLPSQDRVEQGYYKRLRARSKGDPRISWQGILPQEERFQRLAQLDALVIPSRWLETGPLVLLESWAVKTPVIGAALGGIAELVRQGQGGLLFKPQDATDLAKTIERLYRDPALLRKISQSIPEAVRTMSEVASDMETIYQRLKRSR
jgi:glycosyltransferase involved in cell wall biosynthesis